MSIITRIPGVTFTGATLPKLYRDALITPGTKWCYDTGDLYSYVKQAAPVEGVDVWKSLTNAAADASFGGSVGFASGGFVFSAGATEKINLPTSSKVASNANGLLSIFWINWGTQTATTGSGLVGGCISSNANKQWAFTTSFTGSNGNLGFQINNTNPLNISAIPANTKMQIAIAIKRNTSGVLVYSWYRDGVLLGSTISADTVITQPTQTIQIIGGVVGVDYTNGDWNGRVYRAFFDDLSTTPDPLTLVQTDYASNNGRFS